MLIWVVEGATDNNRVVIDVADGMVMADGGEGIGVMVDHTMMITMMTITLMMMNVVPVIDSC